MKRMIYLLTALMLIGAINAQTNQTNQTTTTQAGPTIDEHGCITSAGFVWCALREKCIRPWEEPCNDGRTVPLNSTNITTTTSVSTTTTVTNITTTTEPSLAPTTSSSETTLAAPTTTLEATPILISIPINETNTTTTIPIETSTTIESTTTTVKPVCGNMYQEVGEECDTTASPCGAGRWQCINCKCVPLPEETTTTTIKSLNLTAAGISLNVPSSIDTRLAIGAVFVVLAVVVLILYLAGGKEEKEGTKKP